eukprot:m.181880 g.181880  ORF g.181880 m.181880 type:complete len:281 (-) comp15378_c10_seq2:24-866(-)
MPKHPLGGPHSHAKRAKHLPPHLSGAPALPAPAAAAAAAPVPQLSDATILASELMAPVPPIVMRFAQLPTLDLTPMEYVEQFARERIRSGLTKGETEVHSEFEDKLRDKGLALNAPTPAKNRRRGPQKQETNLPPHRLPAQKMREVEARASEKESTRYCDYEPLHELWKGYISNLLLSVSRSEVGIQAKLIKADFNGAVLTVTRSRNVSLVRASGIVIRETENSFQLVTRADRVITVPKAHSVFEINTGGATCCIYGDNFCFRASERAVRKFKTKSTIDL